MRWRPWIVAFLPTGLLLLGLAVDFAGDVRGRDFHSWIDPRMYFLAAREVRAGQIPPPSLMIPTLFPFLAAPCAGAIASALWVNVLLFVALAVVVHLLCPTLGIRAPPWVVLAVIVTSPLVTGLSRTLYCELMLAAALALLYAVWLRCGEFRRTGDVWLFAVALALALVSKNTSVVFIGGAWIAFLAAALARPSWTVARRFTLATACAVILAAIVHLTLLQPSLAYYLHVGGSDTSAMALIGPGQRWSLPSLVYYPWQFVRVGLMGVAVFLALTVLTLLPRARGHNLLPATLPLRMLWLWLLVPLFALTLMPMKEPRHILPCVVPAVLLMFCGLSSVRLPAIRRALTAALLLVAAAQYLLVTHHLLASPYFVDRPAGSAALIAALHPMQYPPEARTAADRENFREYTLQHWAHSTNFALAGFDLGDAADTAWLLSPGVVYDLDRLPPDPGSSPAPAYDRFEDLYSYTHFSLYNCRNGWPHPYFTLPRQQIVDNADFILLRNAEPGDATHRFPAHRLLARVDTPRGTLLVLQAAGATTPYRLLYARAFLARHAGGATLDQRELDTLCYDMFKTVFLQHRIPGPRELLADFPPNYVPGRSLRPIYWFGSHILRSQPYLDRAYDRFVEQAKTSRP